MDAEEGEEEAGRARDVLHRLAAKKRLCAGQGEKFAGGALEFQASSWKNSMLNSVVEVVGNLGSRKVQSGKRNNIGDPPSACRT